MKTSKLINAAECPFRAPEMNCYLSKDDKFKCDLGGRYIDYHYALPPYQCPLTSENDWEGYYDGEDA